MKKRIKGIDVARALAVFGMILVNFKIVIGSETSNEWLYRFTEFFSGKAAATFVVLAGIGLALMTNTAVKNKDVEKLKIGRLRILKRALFLFVVGLSYIVIWPADILHFYGIYMLVTVLVIGLAPRFSLWAGIGLILLYPLLMLVFDYEANWNFETLNYANFWSIDGFFRNLFLNGFHPVIPWAAFMLIGLWFGRQDLNDEKFIKKSLWISLGIFIALQLISYFGIEFLSEGDEATKKELAEIIGTSPMPPLPIYMLSGSSIAIAIISACILVASRFENAPIIDALYKTGQLALTFYVAHVVIGMGIVLVFIAKEGTMSLEFSVLYALGFSLACIVFAVIWRKYKKAGPLEWVMRKLTD